jgi:hypothetical protein
MPDDDAAYLASLAERGHATCCAPPWPADGGCRADLLEADFVEEAGLAWAQQHATRYLARSAPAAPATPAPSTKAQARSRRRSPGTATTAGGPGCRGACPSRHRWGR